jgi:hypothetical protein
MNDEQILTLVASISTCLFLLSEILGMSKCDANAVVEIYKIFSCYHQVKKEIRVVQDDETTIIN